MEKLPQNGRVTFWSMLRTRMAVSYVLVTVFIVLLLEGLALTAAYILLTQTPVMEHFTLGWAGNTARTLAYQAAVQGGGAALDPSTTFEPGRPASIQAGFGGFDPQAEYPPELFMQMDIPYIPPGVSASANPAVAMLIAPDGRLVSSSYPDSFPAGSEAAEVLPDRSALIAAALSGTPQGVVQETPNGDVAFVARTVWSRDRQPLGAIVIRTPASGPPAIIPGGEIYSVLLPSAVGWLCLMLPFGVLFGFLTTRGLIRRIERLAGATARFTRGDFSQRVPVSRRDEVGQLEQRFNTMAEQLVESFAARQTLAEQSARREERARIEQEMSSARYIQQSLLPKEVPAAPGWQIQPFYRPAREVGGDLYDFLHLPDGKIGIVIGDVTGKGMPAAIIMATTCAMIRAAASAAASPGETLARVNNLLQDYITGSMFATCFYAVLEPSSGRLCYANAGHNLPLLARNGGGAELRATGMPLGLLPDQSYNEEEIVINGDDLILFYTDGLVEAHNPAREMFSLPRLHALMKNHAAPEHMIAQLLTELEQFTGPEWEQEDDITLLVVKKAA